MKTSRNRKKDDMIDNLRMARVLVEALILRIKTGENVSYMDIQEAITELSKAQDATRYFDPNDR
jgi:hypothetical protein